LKQQFGGVHNKEFNLEFKLGGLHEKHTVATWKLEASQYLLEARGRPRKRGPIWLVGQRHLAISSATTDDNRNRLKFSEQAYCYKLQVLFVTTDFFEMEEKRRNSAQGFILLDIILSAWGYQVVAPWGGALVNRILTSWFLLRA
jgi:hypothetical protein